jgi:rod shape-determining protein MreD
VSAVKLLVILGIIGLVEHLFSLYLTSLLYVDLFLVFTVYVGFVTSQTNASYTGFLAGALHDVIGGYPIGINGFSKTVVGFAVATMDRYVVLDSTWIRILVVLCATPLNSLVFAGLLYTLGQEIPVHFIRTSIIQALCNSVAGLILFQVLDRVQRGADKQLARPYVD